MGKCILKGGGFVDKEIEVSGYRRFIEVVRDTSELKENPTPVNSKGGGYTVAWYDFVGLVDGVGIFKYRVNNDT